MTKVLSTTLCVALLVFAGTFAAAGSQKVLSTNATPVPCTDCRAPDGSAVILDQPPNQSNGVFADLGCDICGSGIQILGEDFVTAGGTINGLTFWGGCYPLNVCQPHTFVMEVFADDGGAPAATPDCAMVLPSNCTATGIQLFGVDEWECVADSIGCAVGAGTSWIAIFDDSGFGTDDWFWEAGSLDATNGILGSVWATDYPVSAWNVDTDTDMAVIITGVVEGGDGGGDGGDGAVPATSTIGVVLLVLAMLAASAFFLRRRATN